MLTSSDAKFRCMWHMFVWSVMLTLVSQFLDMRDHIAFYIFAAISVLVLPVLTAVYSNTSGRHGAGLLRVGYVFCDPVLACITVTPVLLLTHLPTMVDEYYCLHHYVTMNQTITCLTNNTDIKYDPTYLYDITPPQREILLAEKRSRFNVIEASVGIPILLVLIMGRRTRKMSVHTFLLCFCYWFVIAIESADLVDTVLMGEIFKHTVYTTEAILSIVMIIVNSYAIVTLCSYISPEPPIDSLRKHKSYDKKFDFLYKVFVSVGGVFFAEIPLLVARFQILAGGANQLLLSMTFYLWLMKDVLFIILMIVSVIAAKLGNRPLRVPCKLAFDNTNVVFQPEKRDMYIVHEKRVRFQDPPDEADDKPKVKQKPPKPIQEPIKSSLKQKSSMEHEYQNLKLLLSQNSVPPRNSPMHSPSSARRHASSQSSGLTNYSHSPGNTTNLTTNALVDSTAIVPTVLVTDETGGKVAVVDINKSNKTKQKVSFLFDEDSPQEENSPGVKSKRTDTSDESPL